MWLVKRPVWIVLANYTKNASFELMSGENTNSVLQALYKMTKINIAGLRSRYPKPTKRKLLCMLTD